MAAPRPAEGHAAHDAHQRQIDRHAGVLEHPLLEQILEIGGVGHEEGAVEDGPVLLGAAVEQVAVAVEGIDGAGVLQQRQPCREQQHAPHGAAQEGLPRQDGKAARPHAVGPGRQHAEEVEDQEHRLPGEEEVVVDEVQRHPEGEGAPPAVQHRVVQRSQQIGEQRHHVEKMIEKDVIDRKARECVQAGGHHAPILPAHPAARPQVGAAARQGDLQAEQRHHHPGHQPRGHPQRQPEEGAAQQIEGVGIDEPAAQVGGPAEGPALFDEGVGVLVEVDLLVVEVPGVVEIPAAESRVRDAVGQKQRRRHCEAEPENFPVP